MTRVELVNLTRRYGPAGPGVVDLNLTVEAGELMVLLGPSGCGKTTTLRLIAGLMQPTHGEVRFDGQSVLGVPPERRGVAMVLQQHALFPFMSVGDNVAYGLKLRKLPRPEIRRRVAEVLATVQLPGFESRWPDQLSGGQRQRVALARVLAIHPKVLLLDEPLSSLEPDLREELRAMIRTVQHHAGITTILVTHDQQEALALGDRVALLFDGRLHQVGAPRTFYTAPSDLRVARFFGGINVWPGCKQGPVVDSPAGRLQVAAESAPDGPVTVGVRPEAVRVGANGYNNLEGIVTALEFQGTAARCTAQVGEAVLHFAVPPYDAYHRGQPVTLHIPRERICVFPADSTASLDGAYRGEARPAST